ncbi:MAG: type I restriction endonuclease subunit R [Melioribacteraceae bacterium]|nr:type I restriction endonuclease subunit R [Melioribacteraceae bacterium]
MPNLITEDQIEQEILKKLKDNHSYRILNCFTKEAENLNDKTNRDHKTEVVFKDILKAKLIDLNKGVPEETIYSAIDRLIQKRFSLSPVHANQEIYELIKDGIPVEFENSEGVKENLSLKVIDFTSPNNNDFLAVSQLWIKGEHYFRRPDILIYINGIPLVFIELKNSNIQLKNAFDDNLTNYKKDIPQLFHYNAFCILSNARETKVGSFSAGWEFFFNWFRPDDEKEKINRLKIENDQTSIERVIEGLLKKERLLDYIENFILYHNNFQKIIAQNHQFLGVNKAIISFQDRKTKDGKLGVFWHTQGSGKSFSMIFLMRKILRKFNGSFTFLVITDRDDLDGQIYRNFLSTEAVKEADAAQPKDSEELRHFLTLNKKIIFTLIHKFRYPRGQQYPKLSDRDDIIVFVDEAHRTQYKTLADNMRVGIPNAQYFAFTGTPLLGRDRITNEYFGDYVSEYNFAQSMDEGATVPLFYQKNVPTLVLQNDSLDDEFYEILEDENLTDKQIEKLEKEYSTPLEAIKRDPRLELVAKHIVDHFVNRGYLGKGMVISVDKFTAVKMYDKVQRYWSDKKRELRGAKNKTNSQAEKEKIQEIINYMNSVEMAVVISEDADEENKFTAKGLNIKSHRDKLNTIDENGHDIEYRFKNPEDKLQLVFVCAMWLTGFDVPTLSTLYLDKPMKGHTLMQTIARANRVSSYKINNISKSNGEIIDYYNVFRNMKKALTEYALGGDDESLPVKDKTELFKLLDEAAEQIKSFFDKLEIDYNSVIDQNETFRQISAFAHFADIILRNDETRKEFFIYENTLSNLYHACKPEIIGDFSRPIIPFANYLRDIIDSVINLQSIEYVKQKISDLLDESVSTDEDNVNEPVVGYKIVQKGKQWDLSKVNFETLKKEFKDHPYKNIEIADLRAFLDNKIDQMVQQNSTRTNFAERFKRIIDEYNAGSTSTEDAYDEFVNLTADLNEEQTRAYKEGLTEDELEIFDLLKKDKLTKAEEQKVKLASKQLIKRLKEEEPRVLIQDWYKHQQSRERVLDRIENTLDKELPESYSRTIFHNKLNAAYNLIYDYALKGQKWVVD